MPSPVMGGASPVRCLPRPPCLVAIVTSACLPAAFPSQRAIDGSGGESERVRARAGAVSGRARPNRVKLVGRREGSGGEDDWPGERERGVVEGGLAALKLVANRGGAWKRTLS